MDQATPVSAHAEATSEEADADRLAALEEVVGALQRQVRALETRLKGMRSEVRTRRVVVATPDGFDRVVLSAGANHGAVRVSARDTTSVALCAEDGSPSSEAESDSWAEVFLSGGGNGMGTFGVATDRDGRARTELCVHDATARVAVTVDAKGLRTGPAW